MHVSQLVIANYNILHVTKPVVQPFFQGFWFFLEEKHIEFCLAFSETLCFTWTKRVYKRDSSVLYGLVEQCGFHVQCWVYQIFDIPAAGIGSKAAGLGALLHVYRRKMLSTTS